MMAVNNVYQDPDKNLNTAILPHQNPRISAIWYVLPEVNGND